MIQSYLTGEMVPVAQGNRRPLAIMMSNDKTALPQYGINRAGVVYEAPVEGNMNRYLAIMENYDDLTRIGSVRSCRTYYVYFAREFDAIYAHYGQSTFAKPYLSAIDNINGIDGIGETAYFRSKDRKAPHNAYASFAGIQKTISKLGYSQEYDSSYEGHFRFAPEGQPAGMNGADARPANKVTPGYPLNNPWFEYHPDDGLYYRSQHLSGSTDGPHIDALTGKQLTFKNILVQNTFYEELGEGYLAFQCHDTTRDGWFFTNGRGIHVNWEKTSDYGATRYYDDNGDEVVLNAGKTMICIVEDGDSFTFH